MRKVLGKNRTVRVSVCQMNEIITSRRQDIPPEDSSAFATMSFISVCMVVYLHTGHATANVMFEVANERFSEKCKFFFNYCLCLQGLFYFSCGIISRTFRIAAKATHTKCIHAMSVAMFVASVALFSGGRADAVV